MPSLPSALSLDLAIGPVISAGEHQSNYTSIQSAINAIIAALSAGSAATPQLNGNGTTLTWVAGGISSYATSLPGSPTDGQLAVLVDSTTNPTYEWLFRYNASSLNTDKWEFLGGPPVTAREDTSNSTSSTSFVDPTNGCLFTVPRAGIYQVAINGSANFQNHVMSVKMGSPAAVDSDGIGMASGGSITFWGSRIGIVTGPLAALDAIKIQHRSTSGSSVTLFGKSLQVIPVRVS